MSTTLQAPAARQAAVLASIAALHVGAFIVISAGLRLPPGLLPAWPSPIHLLVPPQAPLQVSKPEPVEPVDADSEPLEMPRLELGIKTEVQQTPIGAPEAGSPESGAGPTATAVDYRAPALRTGDARLQALIDSCYPAAARRQGQEGRGVARVVVDATGRASGWNVEQSTGFGTLDPGMGCVARRVQFEPARRDGRAVEATVRMPIFFRLH
jgi:protein TonB